MGALVVLLMQRHKTISERGVKSEKYINRAGGGGAPFSIFFC